MPMLSRQQIILDTLNAHSGVTGNPEKKKWICASCGVELSGFRTDRPGSLDITPYREHVAAEIEKAIAILDPIRQ
jgi:hypothetical protein